LGKIAVDLEAALRRREVLGAPGDTSMRSIALDSGFNDVSNFNHAFRAEFGMSPRVWRMQRDGISRA
jgi:AraC family transcriptional regulator